MSGSERPSARDLVRRRRGDYRTLETGRHHHIGAAPEVQPVLSTDTGESTTETAPVQLAQRTVAQLRQARERYADRMAAAAAGLDFEQAARLRDAMAAVDAELQRRAPAEG
jgi:excinuclease UvrABC helicase subunit UvrB